METVLKDFWMHPPPITDKKLVRDGSQEKLIETPKNYSKGYIFNNPLFKKKFLNVDTFLKSGGKLKDLFPSNLNFDDLLEFAVGIFQS